uniref:Uncharacterized protein n=2 Tax=Meloidogyne enterolobii TaxID=390850 RepID=A0A6V7XHL7_MELEN|nr:unnamed protein product [Meloidogyne enterolobii]
MFSVTPRLARKDGRTRLGAKCLGVSCRFFSKAKFYYSVFILGFVLISMGFYFCSLLNNLINPQYILINSVTVYFILLPSGFLAISILIIVDSLIVLLRKMSSTTKSQNVSNSQFKTPGYIKFLFGGLSGMGATLFVQPLDLVKNRMQLSGMQGKREYSSTFHAVRSIVKNEGFIALYNGLSAGLARQATYTTTRLGLYSWLFEFCSHEGRSPSFAIKAGLGMTSGGIASLFGNPMELALVRMTADGRLPINERRNYKNVLDALIRVAREEGIVTLWRGCTPTGIFG